MVEKGLGGELVHGVWGVCLVEGDFMLELEVFGEAGAFFYVIEVVEEFVWGLE